MSRIKLCYKILLECYENCENNIVITSKSGEEMQMRPRKALDETGVKIKRRQVRRPSHTAYKKSLAELRYSESWERIHIFEMIKESHYVRKSETVLDYGFQVMDSGLQGVDSWFFLSVERGLDSNTYRTPDSLSWIPDYKALDSGSTSKNFRNSGFF